MQRETLAGKVDEVASLSCFDNRGGDDLTGLYALEQFGGLLFEADKRGYRIGSPDVMQRLGSLSEAQNKFHLAFADLHLASYLVYVHAGVSVLVYETLLVFRGQP